MIYLDYHIENNKLKSEEKELNLLYNEKIKLLKTKEASISRYKQLFGVNSSDNAIEKYVEKELEIEIGINVMEGIIETRKKRLDIILQNLINSKNPKDNIYYYKYILGKNRSFILKKINYGKSRYNSFLNEIKLNLKKY